MEAGGLINVSSSHGMKLAAAQPESAGEEDQIVSYSHRNNVRTRRDGNRALVPKHLQGENGGPANQGDCKTACDLPARRAHGDPTASSESQRDPKQHERQLNLP